MTSVCIYAICGRMTGPLACHGLGGEWLRPVGNHGLWAIVGEWTPCTPTLVLLQRYDALQRTLADRLPAVLPARFGTCVRDAAEAAQVLAAREGELRDALEMVRGGVQMTLRTVERDGAGTKAEAVLQAPAAPARHTCARARSLQRAKARWRRSSRSSPPRSPGFARNAWRSAAKWRASSTSCRASAWTPTRTRYSLPQPARASRPR